jgi:transcriptional regulator with XRE-family HTH domain
LSQIKLAARLGISRATLANIETGRQRVLVHQLYAFAKALNLKPNDLLPTPRNETVSADWASLRIQGDLNTQQRRQIAQFVGEAQTGAVKPSDEVDGKRAKGLTRRPRDQTAQRTRN